MGHQHPATRALRYLPRRDNALRIRQWVEADAGDGWIFLNGRPDQLSSVRPLLSAWLEIFTNALMSLPPSRDRRVWLIIDELPSLNRIPSLPDFLAQSRNTLQLPCACQGPTPWRVR